MLINLSSFSAIKDGKKHKIGLEVTGDIKIKIEEVPQHRYYFLPIFKCKIFIDGKLEKEVWLKRASFKLKEKMLRALKEKLPEYEVKIETFYSRKREGEIALIDAFRELGKMISKKYMGKPINQIMTIEYINKYRPLFEIIEDESKK